MRLRTPFLHSSRAATVRAAAGAPAGRAFTLIEMLIAIGAVGLIAVGLAKLFGSTGEVVKLGRRISTMNEFATTLEAQIRRDVAAMAPQGEGFMVIRNQLLLSEQIGLPNNPDNGILLSGDDRNPNARPRRIDELVFFAKGNYTSAREPQFPGRAPVGAAARIYYGHGMKRDAYDPPRLDSDPTWNNTPAWPAGLGRTGPNLYAGSWTLLRHVTVLARPQVSEFMDPGSVITTLPNYLRINAWKDSVVQIGLQPAAASIFRFDPLHLNEPDIKGYAYQKWGATMPSRYQLAMPPPADLARYSDSNLGANNWPSFASGVVDVASQDLSIIRSRVMGMPFPLCDDTFAGKDFTQSTFNFTPLSGAGDPDNAFKDTNYTKNTVHAQKMLMASALPGNDPWLFSGGNMARPDAIASGVPTSEQRMIYAPTPPDFTGNFAGGGTPWPADQPYRQQDQAMLSASNLAVGCTEFIVEWSFGDVFEASTTTTATDPRIGQIVWHGRYRNIPGATAVQPYRGGSTYTGGAIPDGVSVNNVRVPAALIHWPVNIPSTGGTVPWLPDDGSAQWNQQQPVYSFFGYLDPSSRPSDPPGVRDWAWPKLLRFTIGLTDPADPSFEQVIQFIVPVPSRQQ